MCVHDVGHGNREIICVPDVDRLSDLLKFVQTEMARTKPVKNEMFKLPIKSLFR